MAAELQNQNENKFLSRDQFVFRFIDVIGYIFFFFAKNSIFSLNDGNWSQLIILLSIML